MEQHSTLLAALHAEETVLRQVVEVLPSLPKLGDQIARGPSTFSEATSLAQQREDERRRREAVKPPKGSKAAAVQAGVTPDAQQQPPPCPGLVVGDYQSAAPFWLFVEDYFRPVAQEDIRALLPCAGNDPLHDEALLVPFLGREPQAAPAPPGGMRAAGRLLAQQLGGGDDAMERRRLSARMRGVNVGDACMPAEATLEAMAAGFRPDGTPASTLLDTATEEELRGMLSLLMEEEEVPEGLHTLPRTDLQALVLSASSRLAGCHMNATAGCVSSKQQHSVTLAHELALSFPGTGTVPGSCPAPTAKRLALSASCDFMHPYLQLLLQRPPTAYMLHPSQGSSAQHEAAAQHGEDGEEGAAGQAGPSGPGPDGEGGPSSRAEVTGGRGRGRGRGGRGRGRGRSADSAAAAAKQQQQQAVDACKAEQAADGVSGKGPTGSAAHGMVHEAHSGKTTSSSGAGGGGGNESDKQAGRPRKSSGVNYALMAGLRDKSASKAAAVATAVVIEKATGTGAQPGAAVGPKKRGPGGRPLANKPVGQPRAYQFMENPNSNAVTAAVHAVVCAGGPEGSLDAQWSQLDVASDVMSLAPDDEVLAELLALQTELVQQVAINRARVAGLALAAVADAPRQREVHAQRAEWEAAMRFYVARKAEIKRNLKREKREQERKAAIAALEAQASPRVGSGRAKVSKYQDGSYAYAASGLSGRGSERGERERSVGGGERPSPGGSRAMSPAAEVREASAARHGALVDDLHMRSPGDDEVCAVCADGYSAEPNVIVFCDRCDVAVHKDCYSISEIPETAWLCWPCKEYEEAQLAAGKSQEEIRPPRWKLEEQGIDLQQLGGGALDVKCTICPVRGGALKKTTDTRQWCHLVCALWHEGPYLQDTDMCATVENTGAIKPDRRANTCGLCHQHTGAVTKCNFGHCQAYFHPLCARRAGNYLTIRRPGGGKIQYRIYCAQHSPAQREKDDAHYAQLQTQYEAQLQSVPLPREPSSVSVLQASKHSKRTTSKADSQQATSLSASASFSIPHGAPPVSMQQPPLLLPHMPPQDQMLTSLPDLAAGASQLQPLLDSSEAANIGSLPGQARGSLGPSRGGRGDGAASGGGAGGTKRIRLTNVRKAGGGSDSPASIGAGSVLGRGGPLGQGMLAAIASDIRMQAAAMQVQGPMEGGQAEAGMLPLPPLPLTPLGGVSGSELNGMPGSLLALPGGVPPATAGRDMPGASMLLGAPPPALIPGQGLAHAGTAVGTSELFGPPGLPGQSHQSPQTAAPLELAPLQGIPSGQGTPRALMQPQQPVLALGNHAAVAGMSGGILDRQLSGTHAATSSPQQQQQQQQQLQEPPQSGGVSPLAGGSRPGSGQFPSGEGGASTLPLTGALPLGASTPLPVGGQDTAGNEPGSSKSPGLGGTATTTTVPHALSRGPSTAATAAAAAAVAAVSAPKGGGRSEMRQLQRLQDEQRKLEEVKRERQEHEMLIAIATAGSPGFADAVYGHGHGRGPRGTQTHAAAAAAVHAGAAAGGGVVAGAEGSSTGGAGVPQQLFQQQSQQQQAVARGAPVSTSAAAAAVSNAAEHTSRLHVLASKEKHLVLLRQNAGGSILGGARGELEQLRTLTDQLHKRERIKKRVVKEVMGGVSLLLSTDPHVLHNAESAQQLLHLWGGLTPAPGPNPFTTADQDAPPSPIIGSLGPKVGALPGGITLVGALATVPAQQVGTSTTPGGSGANTPRSITRPGTRPPGLAAHPQGQGHAQAQVLADAAGADVGAGGPGTAAAGGTGQGVPPLSAGGARGTKRRNSIGDGVGGGAEHTAAPVSKRMKLPTGRVSGRAKQVAQASSAAATTDAAATAPVTAAGEAGASADTALAPPSAEPSGVAAAVDAAAAAPESAVPANQQAPAPTASEKRKQQEGQAVSTAVAEAVKYTAGAAADSAANEDVPRPELKRKKAAPGSAPPAAARSRARAEGGKPPLPPKPPAASVTVSDAPSTAAAAVAASGPAATAGESSPDQTPGSTPDKMKRGRDWRKHFTKTKDGKWIERRPDQPILGRNRGRSSGGGGAGSNALESMSVSPPEPQQSEQELPMPDGDIADDAGTGAEAGAGFAEPAGRLLGPGVDTQPATAADPAAAGGAVSTGATQGKASRVRTRSHSPSKSGGRSRRASGSGEGAEAHTQQPASTGAAAGSEAQPKRRPSSSSQAAGGAAASASGAAGGSSAPSAATVAAAAGGRKASAGAAPGTPTAARSTRSKAGSATEAAPPSTGAADAGKPATSAAAPTTGGSKAASSSAGAAAAGGGGASRKRKAPSKDAVEPETTAAAVSAPAVNAPAASASAPASAAGADVIDGGMDVEASQDSDDAPLAQLVSNALPNSNTALPNGNTAATKNQQQPSTASAAASPVTAPSARVNSKGTRVVANAKQAAEINQHLASKAPGYKLVEESSLHLESN